MAARTHPATLTPQALHAVLRNRPGIVQVQQIVQRSYHLHVPQAELERLLDEAFRATPLPMVVD